MSQEPIVYGMEVSHRDYTRCPIPPHEWVPDVETKGPKGLVDEGSVVWTKILLDSVSIEDEWFPDPKLWIQER